MASATMPFVKPQWFTNAGVMASSYKLFTYDAGTTTKRATYTDSALSSANANPIILDAFGRASVYLLPQLYKFVLAPPTDSDPPIAPIWTADNIPASSILFTNFDLSGTAGENITTNDVVYLSDGSGGNTAGRWYKADADFTYASTLAYEIGMALAAISTGNSGSIRQIGKMTGLSGLTAGTVYYVSATAGALTSTAPANAIVVGKADTTTSLILDPSWGGASVTARGLVTTGTQTWGGIKTFTVQPKTFIGTAVTAAATIGGVYFTDVVEHSLGASQTNVTLSSTSIPANMLNADGKGVLIRVGATTAWTGANGKNIQIVFNGALVVTSSLASAADPTPLSAKYYIVRVSSSAVDFATTFFSPALGSGVNLAVRIGGLDFTNAITILSRGTTGVGDSMSQTHFSVQALG